MPELLASESSLLMTESLSVAMPVSTAGISSTFGDVVGGLSVPDCAVPIPLFMAESEPVRLDI